MQGDSGRGEQQTDLSCFTALIHLTASTSQCQDSRTQTRSLSGKAPGTWKTVSDLSGCVCINKKLKSEGG